MHSEQEPRIQFSEARQAGSLRGGTDPVDTFCLWAAELQMCCLGQAL